MCLDIPRRQILIGCIALHRSETKLLNKLSAQILNISLFRANLQHFLFCRFKILYLNSKRTLPSDIGHCDST